MQKRAIFIDRDDTLIVNVPYLGDPAQVRLNAGAQEALTRWKAAGYLVLVVSNQSGVGRGLITQNQVLAVNAEMERQLGAGLIDGYYLCYASPEDPYGGEERKPSPVMVLRAVAEHGIDLGGSFFVGDRSVDMGCGKNAGCRTVLVLTGPNDKDQIKARQLADFVAEGLTAAADWTLQLS
jgi:D-glycero-D-manno-heptose 1,7-bisphosphate phosphatase